MRLSSRPALRPSPLWLAVLATPLFIGQAMAAPEVYLHVDGKPVAQGRVDRTTMLRFSLDETFDVGRDTGTPVIEDYDSMMPFPFSAKLDRFTIELQ